MGSAILDYWNEFVAFLKGLPALAKEVPALVKDIPAFVKGLPAQVQDVVPRYFYETVRAVKYFYDPHLAMIVGGIALVGVLLKVFLGGIGGKGVRLIYYGVIFYFVYNDADFRLRFPVQEEARIFAVFAVVGMWLLVTVVGGTIRWMRRRGGGGGLVSVAAGPRIGTASSGGAGEAFNVVRPDTDKKQVMVIMMTDIVGYSAKMEKDEAATYTLLKEHNTIMRRAITTHRGKEIKTIGDAFMVVFESPLDGLRCGIYMQNELFKFNKPRPAHDQLKVRIGIHQGEVIGTGKDVFGEGVNIAARMESITEPGGISISAPVYEQVKGKVEAGFLSIGQPKMKNIANPPEVFRVHLTH